MQQSRTPPATRTPTMEKSPDRRDPPTPAGGLNEEIGQIDPDPDAGRDDPGIPGKAGGGLAGS